MSNSGEYLLLGEACHDTRLATKPTGPRSIPCHTSLDDALQCHGNTLDGRRQITQVDPAPQRLVHKLHILLRRDINHPVTGGLARGRPGTHPRLGPSKVLALAARHKAVLVVGMEILRLLVVLCVLRCGRRVDGTAGKDPPQKGRGAILFIRKRAARCHFPDKPTRGVLFRCNCTGGGGIDETRRVERPPLAGRLTRDAVLGTTQSSGNCKAQGGRECRAAVLCGGEGGLMCASEK